MMIDETCCKPDYRGGSIVNISSSIAQACGVQGLAYQAATLLPVESITADNIFFLIIDGLGYHYLRRQGRGSIFEKYLRGSLSSVLPSTTSTAISSIATAVAPQQHAVTGWFMYLRELGTVTAILPFVPRVGDGVLSRHGIDIADILSLKPVFSQLNRRAQVVMPEWIIDSAYSRVAFAGAERHGYRNLKGFFQQMAELACDTDERKFIYAYWPEFDHLCHEHGVASPKVAEHFEQLNHGFAAFLDKLVGSNSMIIAIADHGLIDTAPDRVIHLADHPDLLDCLSHPLCGEPRLAYCYLRPGNEQRFEAYVRRKLGYCCELYRSADMLHAGLFGVGEPSPQLLHRLGDYCLVMKENYVIKDRLLGEKPFRQIGVHGGMSEDEMRVPLIVKQL